MISINTSPFFLKIQYLFVSLFHMHKITKPFYVIQLQLGLCLAVSSREIQPKTCLLKFSYTSKSGEDLTWYLKGDQAWDWGGVYDCTFLHDRSITSLFQEENHRERGQGVIWCLYPEQKHCRESQHVSMSMTHWSELCYMQPPYCKKRCEMQWLFFLKLGDTVVQIKLKALLRRKQKRMMIRQATHSVCLPDY